MQCYGLIGYPLSHSFSKRFFMNHFKDETSLSYENFELENISLLPEMLTSHPDLKGFNVTAPYKEMILPYLDEIDTETLEVGAVNTVVRQVPTIPSPTAEPHLIGYNTDIFGFEQLLDHATHDTSQKSLSALVLGTGGASKAICYVLKKKGIPFSRVSRYRDKADYIYTDISKSILYNHNIIINTTPLGTYPNLNTYPLLPYEAIGKDYILIDLVYNPTETVFLRQGREHGAATYNGQHMLEQQALKAYEIWGLPSKA